MVVAKMWVSMSRNRARCSHSRSLRILLMLLSICLSLEASDACASSQLPCVCTFRSFDTHARSTIYLRLFHLNPCLCVKGMYPAPHIHQHLATANCEPQPGPHCEQWHGHHKSTRTCTMRSSEHAAHRPLMHSVSHRTLGSRSRRVCHSMSSMHAHLCAVL